MNYTGSQKAGEANKTVDCIHSVMLVLLGTHCIHRESIFTEHITFLVYSPYMVLLNELLTSPQVVPLEGNKSIQPQDSLHTPHSRLKTRACMQRFLL